MSKLLNVNATPKATYLKKHRGLTIALIVGCVVGFFSCIPAYFIWLMEALSMDVQKTQEGCLFAGVIATIGIAIKLILEMIFVLIYMKGSKGVKFATFNTEVLRKRVLICFFITIGLSIIPIILFFLPSIMQLNSQADFNIAMYIFYGAVGSYFISIIPDIVSIVNCSKALRHIRVRGVVESHQVEEVVKKEEV